MLCSAIMRPIFKKRKLRFSYRHWLPGTEAQNKDTNCLMLCNQITIVSTTDSAIVQFLNCNWGQYIHSIGQSRGALKWSFVHFSNHFVWSVSLLRDFQQLISVMPHGTGFKGTKKAAQHQRG